MVFGVILKVLQQHGTTVNVCGAHAGDSGTRRLAPLDYLCDAAGSVFRRNPLKLGMRSEKAFTLRQRNRVRFDSPDSIEIGTGTTNELVSNRNDNFGANVQRTFQ